MEFTPRDIGTFLTPSRSRPDEVHILDELEQNCSCEGFQIRKTSQHLDNLNRKNKTMSYFKITISEIFEPDQSMTATGTTKTEPIEVYSQRVEKLNLGQIIKAVNSIPLGRPAGKTGKDKGVATV